MKTSKTVEQYISNSGHWQEALMLLREILLGLKLQETIKWSSPVFTHYGKNVVGISYYKNFVSMWFYQGVLLNDKHKKLISAQEGVTKALRQWRFETTKEIEKDSSIIQAYIKEAIANAEAGKTIKPEKGKPLVIPPELQEAFKKDKKLKFAYDTMNLTNRRDFADYISSAKRPETRQSRLDKIIPMILEGKGINDKYK